MPESLLRSAGFSRFSPTPLKAAGLLLSAFALSLGLTAPAWADSYKLGPQDKLRVKVYEWRAANSEAHEWAALNGDFYVSAGGDVSIPLIGEVPAAGRTVAELADAIETRLQSRIGLSNKPNAAVEVLEYRPFYITGLVAKPGQYPCPPGLTVLQAISIAGGVVKSTQTGAMGLEREGLQSRGELRSLDTERISLQARQARLSAELQQAQSITFPQELASQSANPAIARIMREETLLFAARQEEVQSQVAALQQTKALVSSEVQELKAKSVALQRQLDLARKELESISSLVSKGLAVSSRQLALDQTAAQFESNRLDVNLQILRAQQDEEKADRDILDLRNKRRNDVLTTLGLTRERLAQIAEKTATSQALIENLEEEAPQIAANLSDSADRKFVYYIVRKDGQKVKVDPANESDSVNPDDTIKVEPESKSTVSLQTDAAVKP